MGQPTPPANNPPADPGATPPADSPSSSTATDNPPGAEQLGDAGKQALDRMKAERNAANAQVKDLEKRLTALEPLAELAKLMGVKPAQGQTELQTLTEQFKAMQAEVATERTGRIRAEVAAAKKLPAALAAVLKGTTAEEMAAHADELLAAVPALAQGNGGTGTPGTPAPDPTQGARGNTTDLEAQLKAAQEKGNAREVIRLKTALAAARART